MSNPLHQNMAQSISENHPAALSERPACHSSRTPASLSSSRLAAARAANSSEFFNCDRAHTAAPRIERVRRRKCRGRADIETSLAGSAVISLALVSRELKRCEDGAEKQPRAKLARHEVRVLALPADPRCLRQRLLHHRGGIDK